MPFGTTEIGWGMILLVLPFWGVVYLIKKYRARNDPVQKYLQQHEAPFLLQVVPISMLLWVLLSLLANCGG